MPQNQRRILALATNPVDGASTRYRVVQWANHLAAAGFELRLEPFYSSRASHVVYRRGRFFAKLLYFAAGVGRRLRVLLQLSRRVDIVLIHRELFPLGWLLMINRLRRFRGTVIYDYDDAMFLPQRRGRGALEWLERLETPRRLMALSDVVFAGNPFLAEYARKYAEHVVLLPTCIDTDRFRPLTHRVRGERLVVGWIGSHSTSKYIETLVPALERVAASIPFELYLVGCSVAVKSRAFSVVQKEWTLQREVEDFQRCDVGVYPLWDDDWSRGKSGFKAIQFMACGVPVVASGVGVTREIITDGRNGLIATTEDDWAEKLTRLLSEGSLRLSLGEQGLRTVEQRYSIRANAPTLIAAITEGIDRRSPVLQKPAADPGDAAQAV